MLRKLSFMFSNVFINFYISISTTFSRTLSSLLQIDQIDNYRKFLQKKNYWLASF